MPSSIRAKLIDTVTILSAALAVVVSLKLLTGRAQASEPSARSDRKLENWSELGKQGHRRGSEHAVVTIVEFGDYECPACRAYNAELNDVLKRYPVDVALVYRHWPLKYHESAYPAAVAAECAGKQGMFDSYHDALYASKRWMPASNEGFVALAEQVKVPDMGAFRACTQLDSLMKNVAIERDVADVKKVGGAGTPTILVNDVLLGSLPDSARLDELIEKQIKARAARN